MKGLVINSIVFFSTGLYAQTIVSPDSTFAENGRVAVEVGISSSGESGMGRRALKMLPDGKMLIATTAKINEFNANRNYWISRLLNTGEVDNSFGTDGKTIIFSGNDGVGNSLENIDVAPDGGVLLCGQRIDPFTLIEEAVIIRLDEDGNQDNNFGENGEVVLRLSPIGSVTSAMDIKVQPDGKIVVLMEVRHSATSPVGLGREFCVARLQANGQLDTEFGTEGVQFYVDASLSDFPSRLAIQPDGKIIMAGIASLSGVSRFRVIRLNSNGEPDVDFGTNGSVIVDRNGQNTPNLTDMILRQDGKIVLTGNLSQGAGSSLLTLVQLQPNGTVDDTFSQDGILDVPAQDIGQKILEENNGDIYIIGRAFDQAAISKVNAEGALISSFGSNGTANVGNANPSSSDLTATFDANGKLFIAGKWVNGDNDFYSLVQLKFTETGLPTSIQLLQEDILFYPNPADQFIRFNTPHEITDIELFDIQGRLILKQKPTENLLDISSLNAGVYFLNIKSAKRIVKANKIVIN